MIEGPEWDPFSLREDMITFYRSSVIQACLDKLADCKHKIEVVTAELEAKNREDQAWIDNYINKRTGKLFIFFGPVVKPDEKTARKYLPIPPEDYSVKGCGLYYTERHHDIKMKLQHIINVKMQVELLYDKIRFSSIDYDKDLFPLTQAEFELLRKYFKE
jgi:hypothetical protein